MSDTNIEDVKEPEIINNSPKDQVDSADTVENQNPKNQGDCAGVVEDQKDSDKVEENPIPTPQEEEETIKKKYGGLIPKKPPLISKDHERAFFDSADWALGKQGAQKPKGPLEALRPKLQPTHHQLRSKRSAYAPADDGEVSVGDQSCPPDGNNSKSTVPENESACHE